MTSLLLCLAGPMQAWGNSSRFTVRGTGSEPSRSGIIGMLAAAQGRRRTDPLEDLISLRFGVRTDQPGSVLRDFHTARTLDGGKSMPLSQRYYLQDAVFVAGLEGDAGLLEGLAAALRRPAFPLFLGRRSCPPSRPLVLGLRDLELEDALRAEPWQASTWFQESRRRRSGGPYRAELVLDSPDGGATSAETVRDVPVSFDPKLREYGWRAVSRSFVPVTVEQGLDDPLDPMLAAEGV